MRALRVVACGVMSVLGYGLCVSAEPARLKLEMVPAVTNILVDQPLVLTLLWSGEGQVYFGDLTINGALRIDIKGDGTRRVFSPKAFVARWREGPRRLSLSGVPVPLDIVLGFDRATDDWAFPKAGRFQVSAVYGEPGGSPVESNAVAVDVQEPRGAEREAHLALRRFRTGPLAVVANEGGPLGELGPVAARYPRSVYIQAQRAADLLHRINRASEGQDPDDPRATPPAERALREEAARRYLEGLLPLAKELSANEGPFQATVLSLLARLYAATGDRVAQRATLEELVREHPLRAAGQDAKRALANMGGERGDNEP